MEKVLVYSFDIMIVDKYGDERWFATLRYNIRRNLFTDDYVVSESELEEFVYSRYSMLRNKKWHIECNEAETHLSNIAKPTKGIYF